MEVLVLGVAMFAVVHILPYLPVRDRLAASALYVPLFALTAAIGVGLMVWGWNLAEAGSLYTPPSATLGAVLAFSGVVVFASSIYRSRIRGTVRHPQLIGLLLWSAGHLLASGDARAVVLFGGLGLWGLGALMASWRREAPAERSHAVRIGFDLLGVAGSLAVAAVVLWLHALISGTPLAF